MSSDRHTLSLILAILLLAGSALACDETPQAAAPSAIPTASLGPTPAPADPSAPPRSNRLGFTQFPHDLTEEASLYPYQKIATDADIIAHHFDAGLPWPQALAGEPYPDEVIGEWQTRLEHTPAGHQIYLAITPINLERSELARYWAEEEDMALPKPWDTYAFDHPDVKAAFLNHAVRAIEFFHPDYVAIGIEANMLLTNAPHHWKAYTDLNRHVYTELKARYPDLPVMVSVFGLAFLPGFRDEDDHPAQMAALDEILQFSDYYALALYPYVGAYLTDYLDTMFDDLFSLSDKPIAITETGFPAEDFSIMGGSLTFESNPAKQDRYITQLLAQADRRGFVFIINFVLRDYDALFDKTGGGDNNIAWRDTGLYDEDGHPRPALETWLAALARPYRGD